MDSQHRPHRKGLGWKQGTITYPDCPRLLSIILKWQCLQPFGEFCFISWIKPIWAPEKQAKFCWKICFCEDIRIFWQASPLKSKQMLGYVVIVHIYFSFYLVFSFKARRGLQRQNFAGQTPQSHLFRVYLRENESFSKTILACSSGAKMR